MPKPNNQMHEKTDCWAFPPLRQLKHSNPYLKATSMKESQTPVADEPKKMRVTR